MGKYFGTDGFRGEANKVLTADHAYKIGRYLGWYYNQNHRGRIIIGKDTRRSSYMFEYALVAGITASGADAFLLHVTTTPSVAYVVRTENFDCGIMVSASHNPYYDNGIKVMDGNGHKISAEVEAALEKYIDGEMGELPFALRDKVGVAWDYAIGRNRYIGYLISLATRSYDGMRVGLDCSNGSTFNIAKSVFDALGAKTYVVGNEPDGTNINMGCGSTHIENLQRLVREKNLDCGFAFDGDADRCIAVDENGIPYGLSPLARGTPKRDRRDAHAGRFIPAGAGNTQAAWTIHVRATVYPRWRGEHGSGDRVCPGERGISPLARGTH